MSRLPWAMAVVLLTVSGARAASDQLPTLKRGTPYSQARASLLHSGYRPIPPINRSIAVPSVGKMSVGPILRRTRAPGWDMACARSSGGLRGARNSW